MFEQQKFFSIFGGRQNSLFFLNPFLHFLKQIELFHRKTVQINIFTGRMNNSASIGKKQMVPGGAGKEPSPLNS